MQLIENFSEFTCSPTLEANQKAEILRKAGREIIHMGFGQSPFPVPERLKQALIENVGEKTYLPTSGLPELCQHVREYYKKRIGFDDDTYDVMVAPGSKLLLYALQMAIKGDLIMPDPSWVSYAPQSRMLGRDVIMTPASLTDKGYTIDPESLQQSITAAQKAGKNPSKIILNYPSNPTGLSITEENLKEIAKICRKENILIISDEIYGAVDFHENYKSIATIAPDITAVTSGLSKHLSLGGWRLGVALIPKKINGLFAMLNNIASETWSCVSSPIQFACVEAYKEHQDIEDHIKACTAIHGLMNTFIADELRQLNLTLPLPQGAFYNYPDFEHYREKLVKNGIKTSQDLSNALLEQEAILTLPGVAFGSPAEKLVLRLSGCDYDGENALNAYLEGEKLDKNFIEKHAPNVFIAPKLYKAFLDRL